MNESTSGSDARTGEGGESQTPEAVAFENALRTVLRVSKEDVERAEEARARKRSVKGQS